MPEAKKYPNSGILFKSNRQRPGRNDSDYNGNLRVTCPGCQHEAEYWMNGWLNEGSKGKFLGIKINPKEHAHRQKQSESVGEEVAKAVANEPEDKENLDIPF